MKRVLYIHQYFKTPEEGGAIRSYYIAKGMVDHGIMVEMITSHNKSKYELKNMEGIKVHYLPVRYTNEYSTIKRLAAFLKFVWHSIRLAQNVQKIDFAYATSTPLTVGIIALWLKWTKKIPYIFEVRDLWPEAPIQLKVLQSKLLIALAKKLEKTIYKNAKSMIALSPGIKAGILNCYQNAQVHVAPNMSDLDFFNDRKMARIKSNGIVIGYFGTFGMANNLSFLLEVASECQKKKLNVLFKLVGEGSQKGDIECLVKNMNLSNIKIYTHKNRYEIRKLMKEVDACITTFSNIPVLETNSPNKFFDGLAAGKISIVNTKGWLKELVEEYNCGFYIDPTKPRDFPNIIRSYITNYEFLLSQKQNSIKLAEEMFDKNEIVNKVCDLVIDYKSEN
jgi:glycosyltransferase involved in cell wall biosynthesis